MEFNEEHDKSHSVLLSEYRSGKKGQGDHLGQSCDDSGNFKKLPLDEDLNYQKVSILSLSNDSEDLRGGKDNTADEDQEVEEE